MKRLYARLVLWLIRPAFEEKARRESEQWKADEPRRRAALEALSREVGANIRKSFEGTGWRLSNDGTWERHAVATGDATS